MNEQTRRAVDQVRATFATLGELQDPASVDVVVAAIVAEVKRLRIGVVEAQLNEEVMVPVSPQLIARLRERADARWSHSAGMLVSRALTAYLTS